MKPAYSLRVPIRLAPGQKLEIGLGVCFTYQDVCIEVVWESSNLYSLTVGMFSSEEEAALWLSKFSVALLWLTIKFRLGLIFESTPTDINLLDEPLVIAPDSPFAGIAKSVEWCEIDGFYPADNTVVRPEHKKLLREEMGRPTVALGIGFSNIVDALEEGLSYTRHNDLLANRKLRLAFEIYASSHFERSSVARFLTLMTALEALTENSLRPQPLVDCIDSFLEQLHSQREYLVALCGQRQFDSFVGGLKSLQGRSIAEKIKSLLETRLGDKPEIEHVARFKSIYGLRSRLLHEGLSDQAEIGNAISTLDILVSAVLRTMLLDEVYRA